MIIKKFLDLLITVESQSRLNESEVINLESNKYIQFNDDENTTISDFKKELRMNEVYYMLNKALM